MSKKTIYWFALSLVFFFLWGNIPAFADVNGNYGLNETIKNADEAGSALTTNSDVNTSAGKIIGVALSFVGAIFFILMIYGGFLWMTARGDEGQVTKAKDMIFAAVIGLVIVLSAYAITSFLGTQLTTSS